jgi:preprotein translocase subunit SecA
MGLGPKRAERTKAYGESHSGPFPGYEGMFYRAQAKIEHRHFRDRKLLMHHEKERKKMLLQMGQDPYLDSPS